MDQIGVFRGRSAEGRGGGADAKDLPAGDLVSFAPVVMQADARDSSKSERQPRLLFAALVFMNEHAVDCCRT